MISTNEVYLSGKCTYHKLWDANGRTFTNMWVRVAIGNSSILVEVPVKQKHMDSPMLAAINNALGQNDAHIFLRGQIVNKKNKEGKIESRIQAPLASLQVATYDIMPINTAIVSGAVGSIEGRYLTISVSYKNPSKNEWKTRDIPVVLPEQGTPEYDQIHRNALEDIKTAKMAIITGSVHPKIETGAEVTHIRASGLIPVK